MMSRLKAAHRVFRGSLCLRNSGIFRVGEDNHRGRKVKLEANVGIWYVMFSFFIRLLVATVVYYIIYTLVQIRIKCLVVIRNCSGAWPIQGDACTNYSTNNSASSVKCMTISSNLPKAVIIAGWWTETLRTFSVFGLFSSGNWDCYVKLVYSVVMLYSRKTRRATRALICYVLTLLPLEKEQNFTWSRNGFDGNPRLQYFFQTFHVITIILIYEIKSLNRKLIVKESWHLNKMFQTSCLYVSGSQLKFTAVRLDLDISSGLAKMLTASLCSCA